DSSPTTRVHDRCVTCVLLAANTGLESSALNVACHLAGARRGIHTHSYGGGNRSRQQDRRTSSRGEAQLAGVGPRRYKSARDRAVRAKPRGESNRSTRCV